MALPPNTNILSGFIVSLFFGFDHVEKKMITGWFRLCFGEDTGIPFPKYSMIGEKSTIGGTIERTYRRRLAISFFPE